MGSLKAFASSLNEVPRVSTHAFRLLNAALPAAAPFWTILKILAVILALEKCARAVKDAVEELSPMPVINCLEKLTAALADLAALFPPIAYVKLLVDIMVALRSMIDDIISLLDAIDAQITLIKAALLDPDPYTVEIGNCAQANLKQESANILIIAGLIAGIVQSFINQMMIIESFLPGNKNDPDTPAGKLYSVTQKITTAQDAIGDFDASTDWPDLRNLLLLLQVCREAILYVESAGKAILGMQFTAPDIDWPTFNNPATGLD